jgi:hypothetical protein
LGLPLDNAEDQTVAKKKQLLQAYSGPDSAMGDVVVGNLLGSQA